MIATQDTPNTEALTAADVARAIGNASFAYDPDKDSAVLKAREQLKAAFLKDGTPLARLGDAVLAAYVDECRSAKLTDEVVIGREVTAEEHQRHLTAIDTTFDAMRAIGAYKPADIGELTQKAALLKIGVDGGDLDLGFDIEGALDADRQRLDVTSDFLETMTDIFAVLAVMPDDHRQALADGAAKAKSAKTRQGWAKIAKLVKGLHRQISFGDGKVEDDQGVVGKAYRAARAAASPKTYFLKAIEAHEAVERIAKSFCEDGTYANYAVNPAGIRHIASLVGTLQQAARDLSNKTSPFLMGGVAVQRVFWPKTDSGSPSPLDLAIAAGEAFERDVHGPGRDTLAEKEVASYDAQQAAQTPDERAAADALADAATEYSRDLYQRRDEVLRAILAVPATTPAEALRKQTAYAALMNERKAPHLMDCEEDKDAALEAAFRDLKSLALFRAPDGGEVSKLAAEWRDEVAREQEAEDAHDWTASHTAGAAWQAKEEQIFATPCGDAADAAAKLEVVIDCYQHLDLSLADEKGPMFEQLKDVLRALTVTRRRGRPSARNLTGDFVPSPPKIDRAAIEAAWDAAVANLSAAQSAEARAAAEHDAAPSAELNETWEAADDALNDAWEALLLTPAPHSGAIAHQIQALAFLCVQGPEPMIPPFDPADPTHVAWAATEGRNDLTKRVAELYRSAWNLNVAECFDPANGTLIGREAISAAWDASRLLHAAE